MSFLGLSFHVEGWVLKLPYAPVFPGCRERPSGQRSGLEPEGCCGKRIGVDTANQCRYELRPRRRPLDPGEAGGCSQGRRGLPGQASERRHRAKGSDNERELGAPDKGTGGSRISFCLSGALLVLGLARSLFFTFTGLWLQVQNVESQGRRFTVDELDDIVEEGIAIPVASQQLEVPYSLVPSRAACLVQPPCIINMIGF